MLNVANSGMKTFTVDIAEAPNPLRFYRNKRNTAVCIGVIGWRVPNDFKLSGPGRIF